MYKLTKLFILSLASFRLLYLLYKERGFLRVGYLFRKYMSLYEETRLLVECPNCLSAWTSIIIYMLSHRTSNKNISYSNSIINILSIWSLTNILVWVYNYTFKDLHEKYMEYITLIDNSTNEYIVIKCHEDQKPKVYDLLDEHRYNLFGDVEFIQENNIDRLVDTKINLYSVESLMSYILSEEWACDSDFMTDEYMEEVKVLAMDLYNKN